MPDNRRLITAVREGRQNPYRKVHGRDVADILGVDTVGAVECWTQVVALPGDNGSVGRGSPRATDLGTVADSAKFTPRSLGTGGHDLFTGQESIGSLTTSTGGVTGGWGRDKGEQLGAINTVETTITRVDEMVGVDGLDVCAEFGSPLGDRLRGARFRAVNCGMASGVVDQFPAEYGGRVGVSSNNRCDVFLK